MAEQTIVRHFMSLPDRTAWSIANVMVECTYRKWRTPDLGRQLLDDFLAAPEKGPPSEVATVFLALGRWQALDPSEEVLEQLLGMFLGQLQGALPQHASEVVYALGKLRHRNEAAVGKLAYHVARARDTRFASTYTKSIYALGALQYRDDSLFLLLCERMLRLIGGASSSDCAHVIWAAGRLKVRHVDLRPVYSHFLAHLEASNPQEITNVLGALGRLELVEYDTAPLLAALEARIEDATTTDCTATLWALVRLSGDGRYA